MKERELNVCRLYVEFLRYSEMIDLLDYLFSDDQYELIKKLKKDLLDLEGIKVSLKDCLKECERQINFVQNFLNDCGINIFEND